MKLNRNKPPGSVTGFDKLTTGSIVFTVKSPESAWKASPPVVFNAKFAESDWLWVPPSVEAVVFKVKSAESTDVTGLFAADTRTFSKRMVARMRTLAEKTAVAEKPVRRIRRVLQGTDDRAGCARKK